MKRENFNKGIALLSAAYGKELGKETIAIYWQILKNYNDKDWIVAVQETIKTSKWFPAVSDLVQFLSPRQEMRTATEEWDEILKSAESGRDHPSISRAAEKALAVVGGYEELRRTSYESLRYAYNKFASAYSELSERKQYQQDQLDYDDNSTILGLPE